ncbi:hypothetical protein BDW74DRAFT_182220 [Aspergillus multicolor]|uniref:uncharacterized protein n=1 Tax=Aspergillus multicolor TaxID=41759 RepID=UPI003CCD36AD
MPTADRPTSSQRDSTTHSTLSSVIAWGALAMWHLGVPIAVGGPVLVVRDDDYEPAIEKLESAGFTRSVLDRAPPPEIMANHPNPKLVLEKINAGYKRVDRTCAVSDYPLGDVAERGAQVYVFSASSAHLHVP